MLLTIETSDAISVEQTEPLSPHNEATYELGKENIRQSLNKIREFCKLLITLNTSSIAAYLALLNYIIPHVTFSNLNNNIFKYSLFIPPLLYLVSLSSFVYLFLPQDYDIYSLNIIELIEDEFEKIMAYNKIIVLFGTFLFFCGLIISIFSIIGFLKIPIFQGGN